jgi:glycosyltransferase involved in cell wall biosynthesis
MTQTKLVGLDMRRATLWPQTGIARYGRNLLEAIQADPPADLLVRAIDIDGTSRWPRAITLGRGSPGWRRVFAEQAGMLKVSRRLDLMHLPWSEGPLKPLCPLVITLFDLATLDEASSYSLGFRAYYNTLLRVHMRSATSVIVTSQSTLDAARERWPHQVYHLIPLAVDPMFTSDHGESRTDEPTILYTGGFDARKRLSDLIAAVALLQHDMPSVRLVLSGAPTHEFIDRAASTLGKGVIFTGYLDDGELASWYRRAWIVAYPTDAEGFGFPIVEAFASGTPVVATRAGSVEEVAAGAAHLVSPGDIDELADTLKRLLSDAELRDSLRVAGILRAASRTWQDVARDTLEVYHQALAR